jgi:hypothetical protein
MPQKRFADTRGTKQLWFISLMSAYLFVNSNTFFFSSTSVATGSGFKIGRSKEKAVCSSLQMLFYVELL